jgi:tetratricopeptide (TPR) repeat protein
MNIPLREAQYDLYKKFKLIHEDAYQAIIAFWETHAHILIDYPFDQYFEIHIAYCDALFETRNYHKYIRASNRAIEDIITQNIYTFQNIDILTHVLSRKAASYYQLKHYTRALDLFREISAIAPRNTMVHYAFREVYITWLRDRMWTFQKIAGSIFCALGAMVICVSLFGDWKLLQPPVQTFLRGTLLFSGSIYCAFEITYRIYARHVLKKNLNDISQRRKKRAYAS